MANSGITASYEGLPKIAKLLLQFFFGWLISGVYRIIRYVETSKSIVTLILGIILVLTGGGFGIFWVIDFVTELLSNKVTILAD